MSTSTNKTNHENDAELSKKEDEVDVSSINSTDSYEVVMLCKK